ncbi:MAG: cupin-like domain-containing protein [Croceibacterium sp.]
MSALNPVLPCSAEDDGQVFPPISRADFVASYPEGPHKLRHNLRDHSLLTLESLATLGESLPQRSVEYNRGDLPIGLEERPGATGLTIGETIRRIETSNSWSVLKNIEQNPAYADLLAQLLSEIRPEIEARTGRMMKTQGFIFVTSPDAITPYHFDPEHNILLQLRGSKEMTIFPAGDARFAPDEVHETYHTGGGRELKWNDHFAPHGLTLRITPGEALFVPVMSPHYVKNGPEVSISLSITWRSEWSFAEADARAFNKVLRARGLQPAAPGRWPARNMAKAIGWRILRKIPGLS